MAIEDIKRTDTEYMNIQNLREFELRSSIIYEMYIRTFSEKKRDYEQTPHIRGFDCNKLKLNEFILFEVNGCRFTLQDIIYNIFPTLFYDKNINDKDNIDLEYIIENYLSNDSFQEVIYKNKQLNSYDTMTKEKFNDCIKNANQTIRIFPKFTNPQLYLDNNHFVTIEHLNLSLPDNEILDFLNTIRINLKNTNTKIKNLEYVNIKIEPNNTSTEHNTSRIKDASYLNDSRKMADIFFTYDIMHYKDDSANKTRRVNYISSQITENNGKFSADDTIKNYNKFAEELIINKEFMHLF